MGARVIAVVVGTIMVTIVRAEIPELYVEIGRFAQVPSRVLYALALQESGVRVASGLKPWPWTLNIEGEAYYFATRDRACEVLMEALTVVDAKRVDVGLAQVNFGWHHERFFEPCDALTPSLNLKVAADLLKGHYELTRDWVTAAGRYHRPAGGRPALNYQKQFEQKLQFVDATS